MINENWIFLGTAIHLVGTSSYIYSVLKGNTRPNRVTWFILAFAPMLSFSSMIAQGVTFQQSLMTFIVGFSPLMIFISTFFAKQPKWEIKPFDLICGALSLVGLVLWLATQEGDLAIVFSIAADLLASLPTLKKSFTHPESESPYLFMLALPNAVIAFLIISKWDFTHAAFPLYLFIVDLVAVLLIYFKLGKLIGRKEAKKPIIS